MSAVTELLLSSEGVLCEGRPHWAAAWRATLRTLLVVALAAYWAAIRRVHEPPWGRIATAVVLGAAGIAALGKLTEAPANISFFRIVITDRRVFIVEADPLRRRATAVGADWISTAAIAQGWLGRVLGYGDLAFGAAGGAARVVRTLARPVHLFRELQATIYPSTPPMSAMAARCSDPQGQQRRH